MEELSKISIGEIKKKLNNKSVVIEFFREQGILFYILLFIGLYYPDFSSFNFAFYLQVLRGEKKVRYIDL